MKAIIIVSILALLLSGCNNQPDIKPADAIKLAKEAAGRISYPPSVYKPSDPARNYINDVRKWPDEVGSKVGMLDICGDACHQDITFTTAITSLMGGQEVDVTFASSWVEYRPPHIEMSHSWRFHIYNDLHVVFLGQQGDELPKVRSDAP